MVYGAGRDGDGMLVDASEALSGRSGIDLAGKSVVAADLDKTLAVSRQPIDKEMAGLIDTLLEHRRMAIITGGQYSQLRKQLVGSLVADTAHLGRLYLFSGCGAELHKFYGGEWHQAYIEELPDAEKRQIRLAIERTLGEIGYRHPDRVYGKVIEERPTQVTFSALGQDAPVEMRMSWDPTLEKRRTLKAELEKRLPDYKVAIGGGTSLDITKKWIDKAYGIRKAMEVLGCGARDMVFIGDALFEGGADYPVVTTGVDCIQVSGPEEGKRVLAAIIRAASGGQRGAPIS